MDSSTKIQLSTGKSRKEEEDNFTYTMPLVSSSVLGFVLHATIELEVFEILAKATSNTQLSASQLASHITNKNPDAATMLDRMLYALASYSILTCSIPDVNGAPRRFYGLSPVGKFFVRNQDGASMAPLLALNQHKVFISSWFELKEAVVEGGVPFERAHGMNAFEYPNVDRRFNNIFNNAMVNPSNIIMKRILEKYNGFDNIKTLVDVGGGLGVNLKMITSKYPNIKGIAFDLPHVVQHAPSFPGLELVGGDMFESVPQGDAIFMKWIFHYWSDVHCLKLLKNCYKALPENGKVIVVINILPVKPDTDKYVSNIAQYDLIMMAHYHGGKERSELEFQALATQAGFKDVHLICRVYTYWLIEFSK